MALIKPLQAVRYNPDKIDQMEDVVTPPYDVIDERAQAAFLAKNPYNMIQLDLSKGLCKEDSCTDRYGRARDLFQQWLDNGILVQDEEPAIYLYFVEYTHPSGRRLTRKGMVSLVGLADFSEGIVKPHEKTFASVTDDRLKLIDTCQAQFSQIFSLYSDADGKIMTALEERCDNKPLCQVTDQDGCVHKLLKVTDEKTIKKVQGEFSDKALYIADGHHRYTTALRLRNVMKERNGELAADSPYNFVAMYSCPMEDEGLSILPTHRLVRLPGNVTADGLVQKMGTCFAVEEIVGATREELLVEILARIDEYKAGAGDDKTTVFGCYHPGEDRCFLLSLQEDCLEKYLGAQPDALKDLDVVVLSDLLIENLLGLVHDRCEKEDRIDYFSDPDDALDLAVKEAAELTGDTPIIFLMNATTVGQVQRIADDNLFMPHKSTYFYPKILTGLLIRKI